MHGIGCRLVRHSDAEEQRCKGSQGGAALQGWQGASGLVYHFKNSVAPQQGCSNNDIATAEAGQPRTKNYS